MFRILGVRISVAGAVLTTTLLAAATAPASTRYASNAGADGATCGTSASPCRSIGQAIANAVAGDTIVVGPAVYGDLDLSGTLGDSPGEENASPGLAIDVTKPLTIVSRDGAGATAIDGGGAPVDLIRLSADGVVLGKKSKGFTIAHAPGLGVHGSANDVRMEGNLLVDTLGALVEGTGTVVKGNWCVGSGIFEITGEGSEVTGNLVIASHFSPAFRFSGPDTTVSKNLAVGNGGGFEVNADLSLSSIASIGHLEHGVRASGAASITKSSFFGNGRSGFGFNCGVGTLAMVAVNASGDFWGAPTGPGPDPAAEM
jgi:hypothetical protein